MKTRYPATLPQAYALPLHEVSAPIYTRVHKAMLALLSLAFVLLAIAGAAQAQPDAEIRAMLKERDQEIKRLLGTKDTFTDAQREELRDVINSLIDFKAMGRAALGDHWGELTEVQRTDFVNVFGDIVRAQSLADLDVYRAKVTYGAITVEGDAARVVTETMIEDTPVPVEYVLVRHGDAWFAQDIILDEVSTVDGYARSFQSVIRKKGFDALMRSLNKKRDKVLAES